MHPFKSTHLAWSVAIASLALWATSVPVSLGSALADSARLIGQATDGTTESSTSIDIQQGDTTIVTNNGSQGTECPTLPPAIAQLIPPTPTPGPAVAGSQATFHLCGADPQTAAAIEQLIAGHGFSATLSAQGDGCADLTIRVTSGVVSGSSSSNLSVSLGAGRRLIVQIASDNGVTHASIAEG